MVDNREMTIIEHLEELRERLIKSVIALAVTTLISLLYSPQLIKLMLAPAGEVAVVFLRPTEGVIV